MAQIFKLEIEDQKTKLVNIGGAWKGETKTKRKKIDIVIKNKITLFPGERIQLLENKDGGTPTLDKDGKERKNKGGYPIVKPHYDACIGGYNSNVEVIENEEVKAEVDAIIREEAGN